MCDGLVGALHDDVNLTFVTERSLRSDAVRRSGHTAVIKYPQTVIRLGKLGKLMNVGTAADPVAYSVVI